MKIPKYIYICIFCVLGCKFKSNYNNEITNRLTAYVNEVSKKIATYDTMDNYVFKNISIEKKLDSNNYTNILIMGFLGKEDTVGYFRKKFNAIYYLDNDYLFLQVKSKQINYNYIKMHEQLFFDFSFRENSIIKFVGQPPFDGLNTFKI